MLMQTKWNVMCAQRAKDKDKESPKWNWKDKGIKAIKDKAIQIKAIKDNMEKPIDFWLRKGKAVGETKPTES